MVEYERQPQATPQATPQTFAPPLPPSDPAEETKQQEGVVEYEASALPLPPSQERSVPVNVSLRGEHVV